MYNIEMDLRKIEWDGMDRINLPQDWNQRRVLVNRVTNLRVPKDAGNFLSSCTTGDLSKRAQLHGASSIAMDCFS
jgi:hypothetical protein